MDTFITIVAANKPMTAIRNTKLLYRSFLLMALTTNCSIAQGNQVQSINIEDIMIGRSSILQKVDSIDRNGYYRYTDKRSFIHEFGQPDEIQTRNDDLMETEIVSMKYGTSYVEFFDHSF